MGLCTSKETTDTSSKWIPVVSKSSYYKPQFDINAKFIIIWLDPNINELSEDIQNSIAHLRHIVYSIITFTDPDQCISYLAQVKDKKVLFIVSGICGEYIIPLISEIPQLTLIYIFCNDKPKHERWARKYSKVKGVFTDIKPICNALTHAIRQLENNLMSISIVASSPINDPNALGQSFMYSQLLKEILLEMKYDEKHKKEFVDFCRTNYSDNIKEQLQIIDEFEREYDSSLSIWWYTRESFIYSTLNKALRTQDVKVIIKMGFFIRDLHRQIEQLHSQANNRCLLTVYRGQGMKHSDFIEVKKSQHGLFSFNNFLSTSVDREVACFYADSVSQDPDLIEILFQIEIDPLITATPFASLDNISYFGNQEKEIIFSIHTVFRIGEMKQVTGRLWQVNLISTSDDDKQLAHLTKYMRKAIHQPTEIHRLGSLMIKMGEFDQAEEIYTTLLKRTPDNDQKQLAQVYHQLGFINDEKGDLNSAFSYYQQSLNIQLNYMEWHNPQLCSTYTNIGSIAKRRGNLDTALYYFEHVLNIDLQTPQPDQLKIAADHNNIAGVQHDQGKYDQAIISYECALKIKVDHLPSLHPSIAITYNNIAGVYYSMGNCSHAHSFYMEALKIEKRSLPNNHPSLALTNNNIANALDGLGRTQEAIEYAERAVTVRANHPQMKKYQRDLEQLKRKI